VNLDLLFDAHKWQPITEPTTWSFLARGLVLTLQVTAVATVVSLALGMVLALLRLSRAPALHYPAVLWIEVTRALPVLFVIFFTFFTALHFHLNLPIWVAAAAGLTIYTSSVAAEIIRAGITSIEAGQLEAARGLGLSYLQMMRFVVLPQALRRMVPPLVSQLITLLKDTSLASIIGLNELLTQGQILYRFYGNPLQTLLSVAAVYFVINFTLSRLSRRLEASRRQREPRIRIAPRETEAAA
jgi:putative glutamine transport system permease protein